MSKGTQAIAGLAELEEDVLAPTAESHPAIFVIILIIYG